MSKIQSYWLQVSYRKQLLTLFLLGGLMATALPPLFILPALIPGLVALFWSLETEKSYVRTFLFGWALGFGFYVASLYWIGHAIAVDLATFWWVMPFALVVFQSLLAIFFGTVTLATKLVQKKLGLHGWALVWVLAIFWIIADLLRSVIFTGFPWNLLGTSLSVYPVLMQLASVGGVHLLTLLVLVWAVIPALAASKTTRSSSLIGFILIPVLIVGFGVFRLNNLKSEVVEFQPNVQLRLVQANIPQSLKWDPKLSQTNLQKHVDMSIQTASDGMTPNLVIWPETAVPYPLNRWPEARQKLASTVLQPLLTGEAKNGATLITGANRIEGEGNSIKAWNHLYAMDPSGNLIGGYDKHHLVPFGEYIPYAAYLPVAKITQGAVGFTSGEGPKTIGLPNLPSFSPIICYEGIFSARVIDPEWSMANRPEWLLSITNDGWFGISSGPHQHLAATVLRSVEEGLPLVRASNPGISVVTNALGQTMAETSLGEAAILDSKLPMPLMTPPLYAIYGLKTVLVLIFTLFAFVAIATYLNRKKNAEGY